MKLCRITTLIMCDLLKFSWDLLRIFPLEIFQKLEIGRKGFEGFCSIF